MDKVCKDIVTGGKRQNDKKTKLEILYWQNGANKPYKFKKAFNTKRIYQFPFTISCHSLRGFLRQRRLICFRLLFLATAQRISRCSLPSLRGRGWGEGHFYVFYYLCHYDFCPLCHYGFCIILSVIMASASFCLSFGLLSIMSLWLPFPCYFVFYILCPLCLPFILSGLEGLLCKVFLLTY